MLYDRLDNKQKIDADESYSTVIFFHLSLIIVVSVFVPFIILITVILLIILFLFFCGFTGTLLSLLLLLALPLDLFDLFLVHGRHILFHHESDLHLDLLTLSLLLALHLEDAFAFGTVRPDLGISRRLWPLAGSIGLSLAGRDLELNEGLETSEEPLFDELSEDDAKLASGGINLLT